VSVPRVAVVGVGYMGRFHAQKLARLTKEGSAALVGVCDADPERAAEVAAECGVPVLASLDEVAERADAACVAVPTVRHADVAKTLLERGLDVLVEKPIATTREQARALIETAEANGRVLQVGHIERFSRTFREIQPLLTRPRFIEVHRIGPFPNRATDVSVILDLMIHDLDLARMLAGSEVERVEAIGVQVLSKTYDIANARVRFENGCILNLTASRVSTEPMRKLRVFQPDAYVSIDLGTHKIQVLRREGEPGGDELPRISGETLEFDESDALFAQAVAFVETLRDRSEPQVSGEDGYRALDLALRIEESIPPFEELA
jgi:predicted dehydrogenase